MTARARNSSSPGVFSVRDMEDRGGTHWDISPDMRAGAPLVRPRIRMLKRLAWSVVLLAAGWGAFDKRDYWQGPLMSVVDELGLATGSLWSSAPAPGERSAAPPALQPLEEHADIKPDALDMTSAAPGAASVASAATSEKSAADGLETSSDGLTEASPSAGAAKPEPLPPLPALTDPLQKRAQAVGLHPEVSRALLQRFAAVDFRNAGIAISRAIAETPDGEALIWPAKARKGLARFRVHFVPGVSDACRRYVVAVAWDGWLTTAPPMEKCGVPRPKARALKAKSAAIGGN